MSAVAREDTPVTASDDGLFDPALPDGRVDDVSSTEGGEVEGVVFTPATTAAVVVVVLATDVLATVVDAAGAVVLGDVVLDAGAVVEVTGEHTAPGSW